MEFYLNNTLVQQPDGMTGFYLSKKRHSLYRSFIQPKLGLVKGVGEMTFYERDAVLLLDAHTQNLTDAELKFEIKEGDASILDSQIDFSRYTKERNERFVSLIDPTGDLIEKQSDVVFEIMPTSSITIPRTSLAASASLKINESFSTIQANKNGQFVYIAHSVPLKKSTEQSLNGKTKDVENTTNYTAFYANDTDKSLSVTVEIYLNLTCTSNQTCTPSLILESLDSSKQTVQQFTIDQISFDYESTHTIASIQSINVPTGGELILYLSDPNPILSYSITYDQSSYVTVDDDTSEDSTAYGLFANDLFDAILKKISPDFSLYYYAAPIGNLFICNGRGLMSQKTPIKASLKSLFESLDAIAGPLKMSINQNSIGLHNFVRDISASKFSYVTIDQPTQIRYTIDTDRLFKQVVAGFTTYKSQTASSNDELASQITFTTNLKRASNTLQIQSELIASSRLIEKTRRQQFYDQSKKQDTTYDESLFVVYAHSNKPEARIYYKENYDILNADLNPISIAESHSIFWANSSPITQSTSSEAYRQKNAVLKDKPTFLPYVVALNCIITPEDYAAIENTILVSDPENGLVLMYVLTIDYMPFKKEGEHNCFITAIPL